MKGWEEVTPRFSYTVVSTGFLLTLVCPIEKVTLWVDSVVCSWDSKPMWVLEEIKFVRELEVESPTFSSKPGTLSNSPSVLCIIIARHGSSWDILARLVLVDYKLTL